MNFIHLFCRPGNQKNFCTRPLAGLIAMAGIFCAGSMIHPAFGLDLQKQPGYLKGEFIYEQAPFPSCHASTIVETPDGLVCAWFGGEFEKHPGVGIWVSRFEKNAWSAPVEVANGIQYLKADGTNHRHPTWNPVLFQPNGGPLLLFYKAGPDPDYWWGMLTESVDGGKTWSEPKRLPEGIYGPIKNKPVLLSDGRLLCPSSSEDKGWMVHFEFTRDLGKTWSRTAPINDGKKWDAIQPSILFHPDGRLQTIGRSQQGKVFQSWSSDLGKTWTEMTATTLPNPSAGTDAVTLKDGRHLIVYNHTKKGRSPLNVSLSRDGTDWEAALVLEDQPGEYSYPAVIQAGDGKIHITYTWQRTRIKHVLVDSAGLRSRPLKDGKWPSP